jgi:hypothetical protein
MLRRVRIAVVACMLATACYRTDFAPCAVQCLGARECPPSYRCGGDGFCHAGGDTTDCSELIYACGDEVCSARGKDCGDVIDSCGQAIHCGECAAPEACGGGGPNVCGEGACEPRTCSDAHAACGRPSDGCSSTLDCGGCTAPASCGGGGALFTCGCGAVATSALASPRMGHAQVFTGATLIVWGGRFGSDYYNDGAIYSFATRTWSALPVDANTPSHRAGASAVWTGSEMIVWGGYFGNDYLDDGARFSPATGTWIPLPGGAGHPSFRAYHSAVWTGTKMIVWGGELGNTIYDDGAVFDLAAGTWAALPIDARTPSARSSHSAVWTGSEMIVWGGIAGQLTGILECIGGDVFRDGARYRPATGAWTAIAATASAPSFRAGHSAVWTGTRMVVWGGCAGSDYFDDGKAYDPATGGWSAIAGSAACTPSHRAFHRAVWTGEDVLVWGGLLGSDYFDDGTRFAP